MRLTILGAGIAGACAYRAAIDLGHEPTIYTNPHRPAAASIALATLHSPGWERAADQYQAWGVPVKRGAWTTGYRRANPEPTWETKWVAVDPAAALHVPATLSEPDGIVHIDCTAQQSWGTVTWGATWIHPDPTALLTGPHLRVHHYAPYKDITAVAWDSGVRLGSTVANTPDAAATAAAPMFDLAHDLGWIDTRDPGWELHINYRVRNPHHVRRTRHGVLFGGFHRDGYTLAALHAHDAVRQATQ